MALFGIPIFASLVLLLVHAVMVRSNRRALWFSLAAFLAIAATQVIFWSYTFPMNALTQNWTVSPPDIEAARRQWECSHAVNAIITFAAFTLGSLAVLSGRRV